MRDGLRGRTRKQVPSASSARVPGPERTQRARDGADRDGGGLGGGEGKGRRGAASGERGRKGGGGGVGRSPSAG